MFLKLENNPYSRVDWNKTQQHKAQLHAHTYPHGTVEAQDLVDMYKDAGYTVFAITEHDGDDGGTGNTVGATGDERPTYPWEEFSSFPYASEDRTPQEMGMVAIEGNELSTHHHILSLFNDRGSKDERDEMESLRIVGKKGGIAIVAHPDRRNHYRMAEWFEKNKHLIGLELVNQNDRYRGWLARREYNKLLTLFMPFRPLWGSCNDDLHYIHDETFDVSYNILLLDELTDQSVRKALEKGQFYSCTRVYDDDVDYLPPYNGTNSVSPPGSQPPIINVVDVDKEEKRINITAANYNEIRWIAGKDGEVIAQGESFSFKNRTFQEMGLWVRAELHGDEGRAYTQPFGFRIEGWEKPNW